jgi:hypothetical protein
MPLNPYKVVHFPPQCKKKKVGTKPKHFHYQFSVYNRNKSCQVYQTFASLALRTGKTCIARLPNPYNAGLHGNLDEEFLNLGLIRKLAWIACRKLQLHVVP